MTVAQTPFKMGPMARSSYYTRIRSRIAELEDQIKALQTELEELRVAKSVLDRLSEDGEGSDDVTETRRRSPTVAEKIQEVVRDVGPSSSHEIHAALESGWREDLKFETVSSTLSRMKRNGDIVTDGKRWFLPSEADESEPEEEEPSDADTSDGSMSSNGGGEVREQASSTVSPEGATPSASTFHRKMRSSTSHLPFQQPRFPSVEKGG